MEKNLTAIINPYARNSFNEQQIESCSLKPVLTINNRLIRSNGLFGDNYGNATNDSIYIYEISGDCAVLQLEIKKYKTASNLAFAFYDKSLMGDNEKLKNVEEPRTVYQMWHFGAVKRKDFWSKKDWVKVPREIFENINDHVYLCVCTEKEQGAPVVKGIKFPKDRLFFYDLPVATSIYHSQSLKDSKILLGKVMKYENGYVECKGKYEWVDGDQKIIVDNKLWFKGISTTDYKFVYGKQKYDCAAELEVNVFNKKNPPAERKQDITAFVWQSGNEDDEVKKSYLGTGTGNDHPYNKYCYIQDSLSSHTMYSSIVSLTKFTAYNAARYAVRALAKQPVGNRCISMDINNLVYLMGGALYKIETIVTNAYELDRNITEEEFNLIEDLYAINGSHLFYDSAVKYGPNILPESDYYMKQVLGIEEGSNGCEAISKLMSSLFDQIAQYGIELNYVYCDIERIWNDIRALSARRFSARYVTQYPENELYKATGHVEISETGDISKKLRLFYDRIVINDLQKREDIWGKMQRRGFTLSDQTLGDIALARDVKDNKESLYGVYRYQLTLEKRRNPNIWDAVMKEYQNNLFYQYVMQPILEKHPHAKCSVFAHTQAKGYINHASRFETYLGGSVNLNSNMYSCEAIYGGISGEYYQKPCMDNWKMFPNKRTLFSDFVGSVNAVRRSLVSSQSKDHLNGKFNVFISSFNIWVNNYIDNASDKEKAKIIKQLKDGKLLNDLELYYKEFLYHLFLCCPDKAIAYFQVEQKAIKNKGTIDNGGSYYFPFGNGQDNDSYEKYYTSSYSNLQGILEELNSIVKGNKCVTTVKTLATETDPYVASGVEFADKILWRITLKESGKMLLPIDYINAGMPSLGISTSEGKIWFYNAELQNLKQELSGFYGVWIITRKGEKPYFEAAEDYYKSNPAYISQLTDYDKLVAGEMTSEEFRKKANTTLKLHEFAVVGGSLRFLRPITHTLFGESPKFRTISLKFKLNKKAEGFARLLWKYNEDFEIIIGKRKNKGDGLTVSTWTSKPESLKMLKKGKEKLIIGECYELIKYNAFQTELSDNPVKSKIRYELWKLDEEGKRQQLVLADEAEYNYDNPTRGLVYETYIEVLSRDSDFMWDTITIKEFKFYFSQQYEKLEVFRESDGTNIGRLVQETDNYDAPQFETYWCEELVGKLSWLNATNHDIVYRITYKLDGQEQPLDEEFSRITVKANSEGYVLIPLPKFRLFTRTAELTYEKEKVTAPVIVGGEPTTFFMDYYNEYKKNTVMVPIIPRI